MRSLLLILHFRKVPYHMSLVDGPAHLNPWKKMMETLNFCIVVLLGVLVQDKFHPLTLVGEIRSHTHTIEFKGFYYKFQQSLTLFLYEFHNSLPPPPGLIFKGRPSNHKPSWVRISIFLFLTSQVTNPLHPNIIMHTLHTVLFIFSRF